jgi:hypothetical protein
MATTPHQIHLKEDIPQKSPNESKLDSKKLQSTHFFNSIY